MSGFDERIPLHYRNEVVTGDARLLAEALPDESVDLVFTDPLYDRIEDYEWLGRTAARVLKPDSAALIFCANPRLEQAIAALRPLSYGKTLCHHIVKMIHGIPMHRRDAKCGAAWSPCLWMEKGSTQASGRMFDFLIDQWGSGVKHQWMKMDKMGDWIHPLTAQGAVVFDPFTGGGTVPAVCKQLGRNFIAFEIDPATAERARERVRLTPLPLLLPEPEPHPSLFAEVPGC